jgi:peptidoglycan/LPS O-acetylase OafA/YrhL
MIRVSTNEQGNIYSVRLSGTIFNVILVGIVNYLKERKKIRAVAAVAGFIFLAIGSITYIIPEWIFNKLSPPLLVIGGLLLFSAILSGDRFILVVGDPPEVIERREAEEHIKDTKDPYASLNLDIKRLNEYYAINQSQARGSFRWAVFAMLCGFATIIAGIWIFYIKKDSPDTFLTSLSTASGLVINIISGTFLYLHNKTQKRSLFYYGQLIRIQQLGLAIRIAETHSDEREKTIAKNKVIDEILSIVKMTSEADAKAIKNETD